jgi:hypothetical protein
MIAPDKPTWDRQTTHRPILLGFLTVGGNCRPPKTAHVWSQIGQKNQSDSTGDLRALGRLYEQDERGVSELCLLQTAGDAGPQGPPKVQIPKPGVPQIMTMEAKFVRAA